MDDRTLRVLEFSKIRSRLAALTVTAVGRELATALTPSPDPEAVRKAQQGTNEAVALLSDGEVPLRGTADIRDGLRRAQIGSTLDAQDFLALRDTLTTIRQCKGFTHARRDRAPLLADVIHAMGKFDALEEAIRRTVAEDGTILDSASPDLARVRREQHAAHARIREKLDDLLRGPYARMLQDPLITTRGDRYVVPVKQELKGQFPGVLHDQSSSGATAFMEPLAVVPLGNQLRELEIAEREEITRLLRDLTARVGAIAEEIGSAYEALGRVDFAVAKALLAAAMQAAAPRIRTDGVLRLMRARHPILTGEVVPIDVWLGDEFTTLVITGPNTGGKTVTLKTIGLLTVMAQAGLHIPAAEGSEIAVFPKIFADIGDEQSIEQSLSTFSSHMGAIIGILTQLGESVSPSPPGSLALLDEIGAGTDPTEGVALARAIIEYLHRRGVRTVVTTHYNELKTLAYARPGIQNASVEFDVETLRPTYRLLIGIPGRSQALTIATRLGLSSEIVEQAREFLGPDRVTIDRILADIEADRKAYEWELAEASRLRQEAEELRARTEHELASLRAERKKVLARLREEAEALLARIRREAESIIAALKASRDTRLVQQARERLQQLAGEVAAQAEPEPMAAGEPLTEVQPGQQVFIAPLNRPGTVLTPADSRGEVEVEAGAIRIKLQLSALRALAASPASTQQSPTAAPLPRPSHPLPHGDIAPLPPRPSEVRAPGVPEAVPLSISLRGQTVDEAIPKLDKYLDDAFMAGLPHITIVHGKGTGALRKAVHEFLKTHPHVKSFRLGERGEGETGATIVELDIS